VGSSVVFLRRRVICPIVIIYFVLLAIALFAHFPVARRWKHIALPLGGIVGNTTLKIMAPTCFQGQWLSIDGSVLKAISARPQSIEVIVTSNHN
jgi:hypothetical protein